MSVDIFGELSREIVYRKPIMLNKFGESTHHNELHFRNSINLIFRMAFLPGRCHQDLCAGNRRLGSYVQNFVLSN